MRRSAQTPKTSSKAEPGPSAPPHRLPIRHPLEAHALLELQRTVGNRAVERLPRTAARLASGSAPPRDRHEKEADRAAARVMRMSEFPDRGGRSPRNRSDGSAAGTGALDPETRAFMERRFGHDFGGVRVHTDRRAAEAARTAGAEAYTIGSDVIFGGGRYAPQTRAGRELLAHELSHVVQQGAAPPLPADAHGPGGAPPLRLTPVATPQIQMRRWGEGELPPLSGAEFREGVILEALDLVTENAPTLGPALRRVLEGPQAVASVTAVLDEAERRSLGMTRARQDAYMSETAARAVRTFILDSTTSSLDLLPAAQRDRFRDFAWERDDFPGGPSGANEGRAVQMSNRLSEIRPERRANVGDVAVVTRAEHTRQVERHINANLVAIPAFPAPAGGGAAPEQPAGHRLYRDAQAAFMTMRAAALADGIPLIVLSSYRDPAVARRNAERSGNPNAVASFSSHSLGLAVDLRMSMSYTDPGGQQRNLRYTETTTRPMQNVVDMRESPVHKWMFLHGAAYGWFPYQHEPWHWEYNPDGFRDRFREAVNPPPPPPAAAVPEATEERPPAQ